MLFDLLRVFGVILLVALNAFFVAAEFALVSVRDTRIQQLIEARRIGARTVQKLHQNLDEVLNAVQFGITLASLALGWLGEATLAHMFTGPIHNLLALVIPGARAEEYASYYAHLVAIVIAFTLITYLHVILGEVVPKSLALQRAERVALAVATPMEFFMIIFRPFLFVMNNSSRVVLRVFGSRPVREGGVHSPEELKLIVTASSRVGMLPGYQEEMIHRALELGNVTVREIMVPRPDVFSLPSDLPLEEATARVVDEQHSRVPVYDPQRGPEHIIGILYSKDISRLMQTRLQRVRAGLPPLSLEGVTIARIMRPALVVPETKPLTDLLEEFKAKKSHIAIVVDEFGTTVGMVTVEDVLEQIVGEIEDEFDVEEPRTLPHEAAGPLVLDGAENIRDLESEYGIMLPRDEGYETLGGFVLAQLGKIPRGGESFEYESRRYTVLQMEGRRIARVRVEPLQVAATELAGAKS